MDKNLNDKEKQFLKLLGSKIFNLRQERKLTQEEMALVIETGHTQISRLENGVVNSKITTLLKVSEVLNVSIEELFKFEH